MTNKIVGRSISEKKQYSKKLVLLFLLIQACLIAYSSIKHSPTTLEPGFLVSGLSHWQFKRFELFRVNPPLARIVASLPVHLLGYRNNWTRFYDGPGSRAEFRVGEDFIQSNGINSFNLFNYARWACIPFSLLGSYVAFRWSSDLYGVNAGLFTLVLYVFEPNLLAHGELITADAACTAFGLLAGYTFWKWLQQPSWPKALYAGIALGLAELTKMTWLILFGLWPLIWLITIVCLWNKSKCVKEQQFSPKRVQNDSTNHMPSGHFIENGMTNDTTTYLKTTVKQLLIILLIAIYILNLGYLFDGTGTQLKNITFVSSTLTGHKKTGEPGNRFQASFLGEFPIPVPKQYLLGLDSQKKDFEKFNRPSYLMGEWQEHGWWYYYLYGFGVKVPCGIWGIFSVILIWRITKYKKTPGLLQKELVLISMIVALLIVISSQTGFSRHFRYALPVIGLLIVFLGQAMRININWSFKSRKYSISKIWFGVMLAYTIIGTLIIYPHQLSYFNDFAGGPRNGHYHLLGSSNYWGQDLLILREWASQNQVSVTEFISATDLATFDILFPQKANTKTLNRKIRVTNSEQLLGRNSKLKPTGERIGYTLWVVE
ncbi:ArnT family glycosyltransferase [Gimesia aquarii]|uniref:Dolichyl-phosphate-mannose-protein mannosyltransferase n=1 Tax=Gimesia aquarii TaxID=2527964 RepID=A0A517W154_9PLAN|nr:glycosyltransferase family 39 protein [Gimesia aquarii]QDT98980.1 Dolichyl-phosphate-mannose-protein mannosyltransferase [Gimesia aquarii]